MVHRLRGQGPVFATPTKPGHAPAVGFQGLAAMVAASPVPAVAIGGLNAQHVRQTLAAGARGVAMVSAICGQPDPEAAAAAVERPRLNCRKRGYRSDWKTSYGPEGRRYGVSSHCNACRHRPKAISSKRENVDENGQPF